jgi:hypothetical protein
MGRELTKRTFLKVLDLPMKLQYHELREMRGTVNSCSWRREDAVDWSMTPLRSSLDKQANQGSPV